MAASVIRRFSPSIGERSGLPLNTYNFAVRVSIGVPLGLLVWELVQFGRELGRHV